MDFELTEEQRMYQRAVRDFCAGEIKPYAAEILTGPAPFPEPGELTKSWTFMGKTYSA